jgi:glycosyltransferase involved in cell wall biosynthesis
MKICFLMPSHWSGGLGGSEVQVKYIMDFIRQRTEHELVMICRNTEMSDEQEAPIIKTSPLWPFGRYLKAADYFSVRKHLRRQMPDVVYTRRGTPLVGFAAEYCRRFNKRLVFHIAAVEDVAPPRYRALQSIPKRVERPLYEYGLRRADVIIAQAMYQADLLKQNYGLTCSAIIPNFHPTPALVEKATDTRTILWVANLKPVKRPEIFVNLARECECIDDVEFIMIGALQDARYSELLNNAAQLRNFRYLGQQPLEITNQYLGRAHLLVNTSRQEGFSNTFIQAWLRDVPVVSLSVDPDEVLQKHNLGVCCHGSTEQLNSTVKSLLTQPGRLLSLACGIRDTAIDLYGDHNCESLVRLIVGEM